MRQYKDLNLKKLREEAGLDFAHFTYNKGQCSCCYGPLDMADRYWAKGRRPQKINITHRPDGSVQGWSYDRPLKDVQYILFKNADNGSGRVTKEDVICSMPLSKRRRGCYWGASTYRVYIEWQFPLEKMDRVLQGLREQLDADYAVLRPKDELHCIQIVRVEDLRDDDLPQVFNGESQTGGTYGA